MAINENKNISQLSSPPFSGMNKFKLRKASELSIQPARVKGNEIHGLSYFTWHDSDVVGAQCKNCNNIIWLDPRTNPILNEKKPDSVPASGEEYKNYYLNKINRFLQSLPACPSCGNKEYDNFINNVNYPRFPDGTAFDDNDGNIELLNEDGNKIDVYWLDA